MTTSVTGSDRLHGLDAVRGYALLLGIVFHAAASFMPGPPMWIAEDNDPTPTTRSPQPTPKSQSQSQQSTDRDQPTNLSNESTTTSSSTPPSSNDTSPITTQQQQPWDHTSLRAWLEDGSEVRDMLVMIHDKTGVTPAPADHPLMAGLFVEQRKGVQSMMGELDGLLGSYLQRKGVQF